jgi:hypothetical protein
LKSIFTVAGTMKLALSNNRVLLATSKFHPGWKLFPSSNYSNKATTAVAVEASVEQLEVVLLGEDVVGEVQIPTGILTCKVNRKDSHSP